MSRLHRSSLPPCVLLAGDALGSVLGMMRSLGQRGVKIHVFAPPDASQIYAKSRYCTTSIPLPFASDEGVVRELATSWVQKELAGIRPVLFPMNDRMSTYVAQGRIHWDEWFDVVAPRSDLILTLLDKARADELARRVGLNVPRSGFVQLRHELASIVEDLTCPIIIKPTWWLRQGREPFKTKLFANKDELLRLGGELLDGGAVLAVQEYVPGGDESVEVFMFYRSRDGQSLMGCTGRKIRQMPPGAGVMASGQAVLLPDVVESSRTFLETIDYRGLGGIEYKRLDDRIYFIEASVRPEGFHPLAIQAGIDLPWYAYMDAVDGRTPSGVEVRQRGAYWLDGGSYLELWQETGRTFQLCWEAARLLASFRVRPAIWSLRDPLPSIEHGRRFLARKIRGVFTFFSERSS